VKRHRGILLDVAARSKVDGRIVSRRVLIRGLTRHSSVAKSGPMISDPVADSEYRLS
jgi:hypothetical protein